MDAEVDHHVILGLPSGKQGAKLSREDIKKAYRPNLLELHPDKRPDDPNARHNFLMLHASYKILSDKKARQVFDHSLLAKHKSQQQNYKRRRKRSCSDVDERERAVRDAHSAAKAARDKEELIRRENEEVIARVKRDACSKAPHAASTLNKEASTGSNAKEEASTDQCQGDWLEKEFSSNFGGGGFEAKENSFLTKFRKSCPADSYKSKYFPYTEFSSNPKSTCSHGQCDHRTKKSHSENEL